MGVPAFFRWLSRKYPSVIVECVEHKQTDDEGKAIYEDPTLPNPNGVEFDNLYLDMNGIIHPCTHPEDKPAPKNEDEMMIAIFECIDRLFGIVRPRKLVYMAIDGVAPRAKMNQQRSRRFRASKESREKQMEMERIRSDLLAKGCVLPPAKEKGEHFDSNCITPGTPFMDRLSQCLHYYIHDRINNNSAWSGVKVILSDANVPGEGEHKIMDFIRKQRAQPDHDPNTQHVLCGADADLIMLGLATHEPNFTIIREEFLPNKPKPCEICEQFGHDLDKCNGLTTPSTNFKSSVPLGQEVKFIFVRLSVLREYLKQTLEMPNLPFKYDFERVLDDWVFMCFFVGNDFLPHLPSLEIREGAVDRLVELYKKCVYKTKSYLTDSGEVSLKGVQAILGDLGRVEDQIFKERQKKEKEFKEREKNKRMRDNQYNAKVFEKFPIFTPVQVDKNSPNIKPLITNYKDEAAALRKEGFKMHGHKRTATDAGLDVDDENVNDEVRLWEDGFKDRYYESKFDVGPDNKGFRYSVALQYVRGLCWVLKYYYQGCASWNWYFPYHYAPFASDFVNIEGLSTCFEKNTKPFNPLEQLMGVFPAASSSHVPSPWADLMSNPNSPIIDFYPEDFKIDLNGKKYAWQGVALLPFVDERRLFKALQKYYNQLTEEEVRRNKQGDSLLYVSISNVNFDAVKKVADCSNTDKDKGVLVVLNGVGGVILKSDNCVAFGGNMDSPVAGLKSVLKNNVITVRYRDPLYKDGYVFEAKRLHNAIDPPKVLSQHDGKYDRKPVIGFNRSNQTAHVAPGGRRMISAQLGRHAYASDRNYTKNRFTGAAGDVNDNRDMRNYSQQSFNYNRGNYQKYGNSNTRNVYGNNRYHNPYNKPQNDWNRR